MARINMKAAARKAKNIRKRHPSMKWNTAMSQAMKSMSGKKKKSRRLGAVKKRKSPARKKAVTKIKKLHAAEGRAIHSLGSVSTHMAHARAQLKEQIGWAEAQKFAASKKVTKRKIGKRIAALKSTYRKLC